MEVVEETEIIKVYDTFHLDKFIQKVEQHKGLSEQFLEQFESLKEYYYLLIFKDEIAMDIIDNIEEVQLEILRHMVDEMRDFNGADKSLKENTFYTFLRSYEIIEGIILRKAKVDTFF